MNQQPERRKRSKAAPVAVPRDKWIALTMALDASPDISVNDLIIKARRVMSSRREYAERLFSRSDKVNQPERETERDVMLTEEQVAEIEARALEVKELVGVGQFGEDMLALCQTVRALREQLEGTEAGLNYTKRMNHHLSNSDAARAVELFRARAIQLCKDKAAEYEAKHPEAAHVLRAVANKLEQLQ